MDFGGMVSVDGFMGASSQGGGQFPSPLMPSNFGASRQRQQLLGSGFQKHERPAEAEDYDWRSLKLARTEAMASAASTKAAPFLLGSNSHPVFSDGEQMLSFSSPAKQDALMLASDGTLPYYSHPSASSSAHSYLRNAGYYSGSSNVSMHGVLARVRGPFTPSQWLELEHQALIYKYIVANVPVPASLLVPIRRSLTHSGFTPFAGTFGSSSLGWESFHLGYSGNADPEPGRCRRTDGKKWRCSRDAVADQKYCERHMNRGRHRSRKHVEGQNGHAAAKAMPAIAPSQPALTASGSGSCTSLSIASQQAKSLQSNGADLSHPQFNRILMGKDGITDHTQDSGNLSMITSMSSKPINTLFPISKQHNPFESTSQADFGVISSNSLLNPPSCSSDNISFMSNSKLNDHQPRSNPFRQFMDDWPKSHSDRSTITWHEVEDMQSDRTQLSISIPVASSDFSSSSSSPNHEKLSLSPLKLSREYDPIQMGLGVGMLNEASQRQASWIPISWEASMAGPLGEVLTNTNNTPKDQSKNCSSSSLNLLNDGWDSSPRLESSPTGVLQKTSFDSLSSSTRSSPRTENHKANEGTGSLCDDILGKALVKPPAIPSL